MRKVNYDNFMGSIDNCMNAIKDEFPRDDSQEASIARCKLMEAAFWFEKSNRDCES